MMVTIQSQEELLAYLAEKRLISSIKDAHVKYLEGGVSGVVALVREGDYLMLVKQALPRLKVSAVWECDMRRIEVEHKALEVYARIVPDCVPKPFIYDEQNYIMVREAAPESCHTWKDDLMQGIFDDEIAKRSIDALAEVHSHTAADPAVRTAFSDNSFFNELRIKPYILYILDKYPQLRELAGQTVSMLRNDRIALIHGDYSPKNIIVDGSRIYILDMEVACFAHPAFDIAFFINHFLLKSVKNTQLCERYLAMVDMMMERYFARIDYMSPEVLENAAVQVLGFMLLARVDGKSPAEYITLDADKNIVRAMGLSILNQRMSGIRDVLAMVRETLSQAEYEQVR